jgi:hypothetical protein
MRAKRPGANGNRGETTRANGDRGETTQGANGIRGETTRYLSKYKHEITFTVVKELRSKMLGQHPGYFKAVFLKKTQISIVSIYEYTVYIMF